MNKKTWILVVFIVMSLFVSASADVINVEEQLEIADSIRTSDRERFISILSLIENHSESLTNDQKDFFNYLKIYRDVFLQKIDIDSAISKLEVIFSNSKNLPTKYRVMTSIVNYYTVKRDFYMGSLKLESLNYLSNYIKDERLLANGEIMKAIFYHNSEQYELAYKLSYSLRNAVLSPLQECFARYIFIEAAIAIEDEKLSEQHIRDSIHFCESQNEELFITALIANLGEVLLIRTSPDLAYQTLLDGLHFAEESSSPLTRADYYALLGEAAMKSGRTNEAENYALKSLNDSEGFGPTHARVSALNVLANYYEEIQLPVKALSFFKEYIDAKTNYFDLRTSMQIAIQQAKFQAQEKETKISLLDKENSLLKVQAELSNQKIRNNQVILTLVVLMLLLVLLWGFFSRRNHVRFKKLSETDELTGVNNRRKYNELSEQLLQLAKERQLVCSMLIFDLDHFKKINDNYGHVVGDWTLKVVAKAAERKCRGNDIFGRLGGEEFGVFLFNCDVHKAKEIGEYCREAIAEIETQESGHHFSITASFGVTDTTQCTYDFDKLYACADAGMYRAKEQGRNQVYVFSEKNKAGG